MISIFVRIRGGLFLYQNGPEHPDCGRNHLTVRVITGQGSTALGQGVKGHSLPPVGVARVTGPCVNVNSDPQGAFLARQ